MNKFIINNKLNKCKVFLAALTWVTHDVTSLRPGLGPHNVYTLHCAHNHAPLPAPVNTACNVPAQPWGYCDITDCSVLPYKWTFLLLQEIDIFNYGKQTLLIFFCHHPSACKQQISVSVLECLILKIAAVVTGWSFITHRSMTCLGWDNDRIFNNFWNGPT